MLEISTRNKWLVTIGLDFLVQGRAELYMAVFRESMNTEGLLLKAILDAAVNALRLAGDVTRLPLGLLTRAWLRFLIGFQTSGESAQIDLDEAWEIAQSGPMKLHMADIHLHRARLFFREKDYPWESPEADLRAARKLIEQGGYWRRLEELKDAEHVILKKFV